MSENVNVKFLYEDGDVCIEEHLATGLIFFTDLHDDSVVSITAEAFKEAFDAWN